MPSPTRTSTRTSYLAVAALLLATACSTTEETSTSSTGSEPTGDDHGAIAGAREVAEPQPHLLAIGRTGAVGALDLLSEEPTGLGAIGSPTALATDGRYGFATVAGGVAVVDSGVWTWNHGDHSHYYRAEPRLLGTVRGDGPATVSTGPLSTAGGTGVLFPRTGEAVLLDNAALSDGELTETFRLTLPPHDGLVAPLGDGAVVTVPDATGAVSDVELVDAEGEPLPGTRTPCATARGAVTTTVGLVVGCADGALLWTNDEDDDVPPDVERIPYPAGVEAPPATAFEARKHRPTVAALAGREGFWLLDTRERTWQLHRTDAALRQVVAVDDEEQHVVALDRTGRVLVYDGATGRPLAATGPLVARSLGDARTRDGVALVVDQERAYLNGPVEGVVLEIDYGDSARVARELSPPPGADFVTEVGR